MEEDTRSRILRKADHFVWGLRAAALVLAAAGSAAIAWLAMPEVAFLPAWLLVFAVVVLGVAAIVVVRWFIDRRERPGK